MSTWTAPVTFSNTTLTSTTMNTEVRDHLIFLKGALDLITVSTTADTGTLTYLGITRATTAAWAFRTQVSGDTYNRFQIDADGKHHWGSGSATADWQAYRYSTTDFVLNGTVADSKVVIYGGLQLLGDATGAGSSGRNIYFQGRTAETSAPGTGDGFLYVIANNGSGKAALRVRFATGAIQTIATEP